MGRKKTKNNRDNSKESQEDESVSNVSFSGDVKRSMVAILLFALAIISFLSFFSFAGTFGGFLNKMIGYSIGWVKFIFPAFLIVYGIALLLRKETIFYVTKLLGLLAILLSFIGLFHWFFDLQEKLSIAKHGQGGGYIGYAITYVLEKYLGTAGSLVILLSLFFIGFILAFNFSLIDLLLKFKKKKEEAESEEAENEEVEVDEVNEEEVAKEEIVKKEEVEKKEEVDKNIGKIEFVEGRDQYVSAGVKTSNNSENLLPKKKITSKKTIDSGTESENEDVNSNWLLPPMELLEESFGEPNGGDIETNFSIIEKTLRDFGIMVERGGTKTGPAVTQYSFRPAVGVKIAKILSLQNDLSLALAATIRIEAPIPGQSLIGIEIPNKNSLTVRLRNMFSEFEFKRRKSNLTLALGKDVSGDCIFGDLTKMPHLMIAGATGTGKSVCINTIITTLLYQNSPEDLKLIMVDPKRVELSLYNGIPHLLTDVVVENSKAANVLKWAVGEMEKRYKLLQETGSRDLISYKEKIKTGFKIKRTDSETGEVMEEELKKLPYIVIVIDELADLMGTHGKEVEGAIVRIAQMARAVGIHLIVSTQRPSVEVITGLIKANITTRIAFQVATQIDSRTILDMGGAEKLLGNGDMLYLSSSSPKPRRIQGPFISETEVKKVVDFIDMQNKKNKKKKEEEDDELEEEDIFENAQKEILEFKSSGADGGDDELLKAAKDEIIKSKKASASFLQRRLRVGYARAARLLDMLEEEGVIGPADGAKAREIYIGEGNQGIDYDDKIEDQEKRDKWQI